MSTYLTEVLTFDQLFRYSEPKRVKRASTVRGPPLEIQGNSDAVYHSFNFKSFPSTTGLRHHGFIRFMKPRLGNPRKPLQHIPCEVDCTCPDFRYRWAWADKQRGAARIGKQSMNQCINRAPRKTNPGNVPGLCKHILACRDYIYGLLAKFPGREPDTGEKLTQLVAYGKKRWDNFDTLMAKAKDQEKWYAAVKAAINQGQGGNLDLIYDLYQARGGKNLGIPQGVPPRGGGPPPPAPPGAPPPAPPGGVPPLPPRQPAPPRRGPALPAAGRPTVRRPAPAAAPAAKPAAKPAIKKPAAKPAAPAPIAIPPGQRGRGFPTAPPAPPKPAKPPVKNNLPIGRKKAKQAAPPTPPGKRGAAKRAPRKEGAEDFDAARVSRVNGSSDGAKQIDMKLNEAIKLIEDIEHDDVAAPSEIAGEMATDTVDAPPPSEPPVSDTAVGADTEGNVVLQLLADIKDLLSQLVGVEGAEEMGEFGPEGEMPPGGPGEEFGPPGEGEEGEEIPVDAIPEPDEEDEEEDEEEMPPRHAPEGEE